MQKTLFPLLAALAFTIGTATAQDGPRPGGPGDHSAHLAKELGLNADQTARLKAIDDERMQDMQANRNQGKPSGSREDIQARRQADHAKYDARYKEVLTPEQYAKYSQLQAQHPGGKGPADDTKLKAKKNGKVKAKRTDN